MLIHFNDPWPTDVFALPDTQTIGNLAWRFFIEKKKDYILFPKPGKHACLPSMDYTGGRGLKESQTTTSMRKGEAWSSPKQPDDKSSINSSDPFMQKTGVKGRNTYAQSAG
jgi:hypothetical protein